MLGHHPDRLEVLIYELVHIVEGGRRSSRRSGGRRPVVFLAELIDKIRDRRDSLVPRLARRRRGGSTSTWRSRQGAERERTLSHYVQNAHARIAGILRNAGKAEASPEPPEESSPRNVEAEAAASFPEVIREATERRAPHGIPTYAIRSRRLPPLLSPPSRARERRAGVPPRAVRRDEGRARSVARPDRGRSRPHVVRL